MQRFDGSPEQAREGLGLVSEYAAGQDLVRADLPEHDSVRWGIDDATPIFWCVPDERPGGLELWLDEFDEDVQSSLRTELAIFDATDEVSPRVPWSVVVERFDELADRVLDDYVDAWRAL